MNPFRAVQGNIWKKVDLQEWTEKIYLAFFEAVDRFTVLKDGDYTVKITTEGLMKLEQDAFGGQFPFLQELVSRINQLTTDPKATPHKFYLKFATCIRQVGGYLKEHPSLVTDAMREIIQRNPRLAWCLVHFEIKDTKPGIPIMVETKLDKVGGRYPEVMKNPDVNVKMSESRMYLADAMHTITKSLTKKDLRNLTAKERITSALGIMKVLQSAQSFKPNVGVLNQLVINKAGREDLEAAMLDFNSNKEV